jgi:hypothetical protein
MILISQLLGGGMFSISAARFKASKRQLKRFLHPKDFLPVVRKEGEK